MNQVDIHPKKPKAKTKYQYALQRLKEVNRENDYILTKGDPVRMASVRFWVIRDYYSALEQILKDNDRAIKAQKQLKK